MKKISWFFCLSMLACAMLFPSCQEDEKSPARPGDVRFAVRPKAGKDGTTGRKASDLPPGATLYVTVVNAAGVVVYDLKEITLINVGNAVISQPLSLEPGNYTLTEFIVADSQVSYATPKQGSTLAQWVDDPLPVPFTVYDDDVTELGVEVLPFGDGYTPEDFGYVSFNITVAPFPYFKLSVFKPEGETLVLSPVHAYIVDGIDTIYSQVLPAGTHDIAFVGNVERLYELVLVQPGYRKYTRPCILRDLIPDLAGDPVTVTLEQAFTFVTYIGNDVSFDIHGPAENLSIDWGDGTVQRVGDIRDFIDQVSHSYGREGQFFVSVYGSDLSSIQGLEFFYTDGSANEVTLDHLPNLHQFAMSFADSPEVIDFSHNPLISSISMSVSNVKRFILPPGAALHDVSLVYQTGFSPASLSEIIHLAYVNAVTNNVRDGWLYLTDTPYGFSLIAYPTNAEQAFQELRTLRDSYGWEVWGYLD
jgi:hypothetical protein